MEGGSGGTKMKNTRHPGNLVLERVTAEDPRVGLTLLDLLPVYADTMAAIMVWYGPLTKANALAPSDVTHR